MKRSFTLLLTCLAILLGTSSASAACMPLSKSTEAGTLTGEICIDGASVLIAGEVTLPDGDVVTFEATGGIAKKRVNGKMVVMISGKLTINHENESVTLSITASGGNVTIAATNFAGKVIDLVLPPA